METSYSDIKNTPTYKILQKNLEEASKRYLYLKQQPITEYNIDYHNTILDDILANISELQKQTVFQKVKDTIKTNFISQRSATTFAIQTTNNTPIVKYNMHSSATFLPKICSYSNGLDIPIQTNIDIQPYQLLKVNLHIRFQFPQH